MQMDVLRCKTPAMVHKEIWGHLLVYNLIRATMAQAALRHGVVPRQVSLQEARQTLAAFSSELAQASSTRREGVLAIVLTAIISHRVGTRPDRYEPRACKRRPKPYPPKGPAAASPRTLGTSRLRLRKRHSSLIPFFCTVLPRLLHRSRLCCASSF